MRMVFAMGEQGGTRHVVLSGCSGGGKSTLLAALGRRGFRTVAEPGRRIVAEEMHAGGRALPWIDLGAFAQRAVAMALADREGVSAEVGWVFFDRGLLDAAVALEHATGHALETALCGQPHFHRQVFLTPPWREIFATDAQRQHGWEEAVGEYERLLGAFARLGYQTIVLPKVDVDARADVVLAMLSGGA